MLIQKNEENGAEITTINCSENSEYEIEILIRCYTRKKKSFIIYGGKKFQSKCQQKRKRTCRDSPCAGKDLEVPEEQNRFHV